MDERITLLFILFANVVSGVDVDAETRSINSVASASSSR